MCSACLLCCWCSAQHPYPSRTISNNSSLGMCIVCYYSEKGGDFQLRLRLISLCPAAKVCAIFRNRVLPSSAGVQPTAVRITLWFVEYQGILLPVSHRKTTYSWDLRFLPSNLMAPGNIFSYPCTVSSFKHLNRDNFTVLPGTFPDL